MTRIRKRRYLAWGIAACMASFAIGVILVVINAGRGLPMPVSGPALSPQEQDATDLALKFLLSGGLLAIVSALTVIILGIYRAVLCVRKAPHPVRNGSRTPSHD